MKYQNMTQRAKLILAFGGLSALVLLLISTLATNTLMTAHAESNTASQGKAAVSGQPLLAAPICAKHAANEREGSLS